MTDDLLTEAEVAELTRTTPRTLRQWRYQTRHGKPQGPAWFRVGPGHRGRVVYRRKAVEDWLTEQETRAS